MGTAERPGWGVGSTSIRGKVLGAETQEVVRASLWNVEELWGAPMGLRAREWQDLSEEVKRMGLDSL